MLIIVNLELSQNGILLNFIFNAHHGVFLLAVQSVNPQDCYATSLKDMT